MVIEHPFDPLALLLRLGAAGFWTRPSKRLFVPGKTANEVSLRQQRAQLEARRATLLHDRVRLLGESEWPQSKRHAASWRANCRALADVDRALMRVDLRLATWAGVWAERQTQRRRRRPWLEREVRRRLGQVNADGQA